MKHTSVPQAIEFAGNNPVPATDVFLDLPAHYMVCRRLWAIANNSDLSERGAVSKATKAQKLILDRLVGTRRPGTHPAAREAEGIEFADLTAGAIGAAEETE